MCSQPMIISSNGRATESLIWTRFLQEKPHPLENSAQHATFGRAAGSARIVLENHCNVCIAFELTINSILSIELKVGLVLILLHHGCGKLELSFTSVTTVNHVPENSWTLLISLKMKAPIPCRTFRTIRMLQGMVRISTMILKVF